MSGCSVYKVESHYFISSWKKLKETSGAPFQKETQAELEQTNPWRWESSGDQDN